MERRETVVLHFNGNLAAVAPTPTSHELTMSMWVSLLDDYLFDAYLACQTVSLVVVCENFVNWER
jgi:hypothetical protein